MPDQGCLVLKQSWEATRQQSAANAQAYLDLLNATIAVLKARRDRLCDVHGPDYNPVCCSVFGNKVADYSGNYAEQLAQASQWAYDAIQAVDCSSPNWQAQAAEVTAKLADLINLGAEFADLNTALSTWLDEQTGECPATDIHGG